MSFMDDAKDKAEQLAGKAKEGFGKLTGDKETEGSGQTDQAVGEAKEAGHDLRDKAQGAVENIKDRMSDK